MFAFLSSRCSGTTACSRLALVFALAVAGFPASADFFVSTTATLNTTAGGYTDSPFHSAGPSEAYVEIDGPFGSKWFSSAVSDPGGNLEVGLDGTRSLIRGDGQARSRLRISDTYEVTPGLPPPPRPSAVEFTVQPGEILWRSQNGIRPAVGVFEGSLQIELRTMLNRREFMTYSFLLDVHSTNGGIEFTPGSSNNALIHLSQVLSGQGDLWGVRTSGFTDVLLLPLLEPGDLLEIDYIMTAAGSLSGFVDAAFGLSVKFGDPLDGAAAGALVVRTEAAPTPGTVSVPATAWLCLPALAWLGVRRRRCFGRAREGSRR